MLRVSDGVPNPALVRKGSVQKVTSKTRLQEQQELEGGVGWVVGVCEAGVDGVGKDDILGRGNTICQVTEAQQLGNYMAGILRMILNERVLGQVRKSPVAVDWRNELERGEMEVGDPKLLSLQTFRLCNESEKETKRGFKRVFLSILLGEVKLRFPSRRNRARSQRIEKNIQ